MTSEAKSTLYYQRSVRSQERSLDLSQKYVYGTMQWILFVPRHGGKQQRVCWVSIRERSREPEQGRGPKNLYTGSIKSHGQPFGAVRGALVGPLGHP